MEEFAQDTKIPAMGEDVNVHEHGVESCNLFAKLISEMEDTRNKDTVIGKYYWCCCKCGTGPMGLEKPIGLEDCDAAEDFYVEENCIRHDCSHPRCENCEVLPVEQRNTGGLEYLDSKRLVPYHVGAPDYMLGLSLSEVLRSETPSTPGLTISSAGSPDCGGTFEEEELPAPKNLDQQIKEKKSECMLKLADTWYRRWAKQNTKEGITLKPPQKTLVSKLEDPKDFLLVWQQAVLPFLADFVPKWCGPSYTIGIRRAKSPKLRAINIAIEEVWTETQKKNIRYHVLDLLPPNFHQTTSFIFETGLIERLASSTATTESQLDPISYEKNFYYYYRPTMGDSVGVALGQGDDHSTSTLGPCLMIKDKPYWLVNLHPLEAAVKADEHNSHLILEHPSSDDRIGCQTFGHDFMRDYLIDFTLGNVVASSGKCTRTKTSRNPYWEEVFMEAPEVIMDWALCATGTPTTNYLRGSSGPNSRGDKPVVLITQPEGGAPICSIGRTSGYQRGQIGMCPDLVSKKITGAGQDTMEWFVEEAYPYDDQECFVESGIGIPGDSGAGIVDERTDALVGQLWGRNKYKKKESGPRVSYFTPIQDLFDDIKDQNSLSEHPRLPQLDDGSILPSANPACSQCIEMQVTQQQSETSSPDLDFEDMTPPEDEILTPKDVHSPELRRQDIETYQIGISSTFDQNLKNGIFNDWKSVRFEEVMVESGVAINYSSAKSVLGERKRIETGTGTPHGNKRQRSA